MSGAHKLTLLRGGLRKRPGPAIRRIEMLLLPVMVADEQYSGEELDRFLAAARKLLDSGTRESTRL